MKKKEIESKVKNPQTLKQAKKEHDRIVEAEVEREHHQVTFRVERHIDPIIENIVKVTSTENQTNVKILLNNNLYILLYLKYFSFTFIFKCHLF